MGGSVQSFIFSIEIKKAPWRNRLISKRMWTIFFFVFVFVMDCFDDGAPHFPFHAG
jgi:hypothetical protein